jgi:hypothetical protein
VNNRVVTDGVMSANILIADTQIHTRVPLINLTDVDIPLKQGSYISYADAVTVCGEESAETINTCIRVIEEGENDVTESLQAIRL